VAPNAYALMKTADDALCAAKTAGRKNTYHIVDVETT